jgi:hypothetical protein
MNHYNVIYEYLYCNSLLYILVLKKYPQLKNIFVQIYNPNLVGKQILIDVKNIVSEKLNTVERPLMDN